MLDKAKSHVRLLLIVLSLDSRVFIHIVMKLDSVINRHAFGSRELFLHWHRALLGRASMSFL